MAAKIDNSPRILILESDRRACATLRAYTVKGWAGASVQSNGAPLEAMMRDPARLKSFDAILCGCNFSKDGTSGNPTLEALRALTADPSTPPVILLAKSGSEYTAVQAIQSGAFDYISVRHMSRAQVVSSVQRALLSSSTTPRERAVNGILRLFGYDVRRLLASSDNASVHVAFSAERGKEVVLKVLHRGRGALSRDANFERFVDEFKMLYDIDDPAVAEIYDFRVTDQYCYIAMEYFAEGHLGRRITEALAPTDALRIAVEIAHALSIIHTAGVVHRDLKPGNIMLRADETAALIDFGISQSEDAANLEPELISGTPYYMSPEQVDGGDTDERTDLYALGVIVYQMLVGEKPYVGENTEAILEQHRSAPVPNLPPPLEKYQPLIDRLMAKSVDQRVPNARELVELIEETGPAEKDPASESNSASQDVSVASAG